MSLFNLFVRIERPYSNSYTPLEIDYSFTSKTKEENIDRYLNLLKRYILRAIEKENENIQMEIKNGTKK